jgi:hypothetical protein
MSRKNQRTLRRFVVFLVVCTLTAVVSVASVATAQRGKKPAGKKPSTTQTPEGGKPESDKAGGSAPKAEPKGFELRDGGSGSADRGGDRGGGATETRTGDGGVKSFRFEEVAIEGRLQSPELVYFLRRVRAEFNAGDLGHRSFTGELSDTKHDPNLR